MSISWLQEEDLALPLAAATLMAQSVDSNATLGNTDLSSEFGFWAGAASAGRVIFVPAVNRAVLGETNESYGVNYDSRFLSSEIWTYR